VRLGACVAFELAIGVAASAVVAIGVHRGLGELRHWERTAQAATLAADGPAAISAPDPHASIGALLEAVATVDRVPPRQPVEIFDGVRDELLLAPLRAARITEVKFNRGGSSISLRIDFDNGARAAFKPEQSNFQTIPRREVAAYRINRLLGMGSVALGRSFDLEEIIAAVEPDSREFIPRLRAEILAEDGKVTGELSWWIPVIRRARVNGYYIDETDGIVTWKRYLRVGNDIPAAEWRLMAQISDMLVFDFLINNSDRWSGRNAQASADGQVLYFMDNTLSFGNDPKGHSKVRTYLERAQKFSRSLVERLRRLSADEVHTAIDADTGDFDYLLDEDEIAALLSRRDHLLGYIDQLIAQHGEQAVLAFP
jgi:hypothetical protein